MGEEQATEAVDKQLIICTPHSLHVKLYPYYNKKHMGHP